LIDNPFLAFLGATRHVWRKDHCEFRLTVRPELLNRQGILQGGVVSTLLDAACGYAGLYSPSLHEPLHGYTVSLALNFMNKGSGTFVSARGYVEQRGRSIFFARGEAWMDARILLATAQGTFKLLRDEA
jgi:uncharacterized protein (TIGR00369 family)